MKNKSKIIGIFILTIFSFYYTEKIAIYVQDKTPLKKQIISYQKENNVLSVNAIVTGEYVTPGLNGINVDVNKTFKKMRAHNVFSEQDIVYKEVKPKLSLNSYKNKIISAGNSLKSSITFVISNNSRLKEKFTNEGISYSVLKNNYYCFYEFDNNCYSKQKVKLTYIIDNDNFSRYISKVKSGDILYLSDSLKEEYLNMLITRINFFNYKIVCIDELLSESLLN